MVSRLFQEIGLRVNAKKSKAIITENGMQTERPLFVDRLTSIEAARIGEKIRFSSATISKQIDFGPAKIMQQVSENVKNS